MGSTKLRIAWFSDLPNNGVVRTISAYTSQLLLPLLRTRCEIDLYHNAFWQYEDYPTFHCLTAKRRAKQHPYDVVLYQLEDSPLTQWVRIHCGLMPGIQWSHDFLFTTFGPEPILNSPWSAVLDLYHDASLAWPVRFDEQYQRGPYGIREAAYAPIRMFSQAGMVTDCLRESEKALFDTAKQVTGYLPLPAPIQHQTEDEAVRKRVLFCGSPWVQHRAHKLFAALARLEETVTLVCLVDESEVDGINDLAKEFGLDSLEVHVGRTPAAWQTLLAKGGVCVHTLFSVYGQTGPYLPLSMAAGLPCVVTRFGHTESLPESIVFKIQPGECEAAEIESVLRSLFATRWQDVSQSVRSFAQEVHDPEVVAQECMILFETQQPLLKEAQGRWELLEQKARMDLITEAKDLLSGVEEFPAQKTWIDSVYAELGWVHE